MQLLIQPAHLLLNSCSVSPASGTRTIAAKTAKRMIRTATASSYVKSTDSVVSVVLTSVVVVTTDEDVVGVGVSVVDVTTVEVVVVVVVGGGVTTVTDGDGAMTTLGLV